MKQKQKQGDLVEIEITGLTSSGEGVGRDENKAIFVPDTVTGDRLLVRLTKVKSNYCQGKIEEIIEASPYRIRPRCMVADKCGGCQWQHINYEYQLEAKQNMIRETLRRIGGLGETEINPLLYGSPLRYRNKVSYPLRYSLSTGEVKAGYYQKASHKLINLNQCPVQDEKLDPFLAEIKKDFLPLGWTIYNEAKETGQLRHLSLRVSRYTGEVLLTLISTTKNLPKLTQQAQIWLQRYPNLVGVCLNYNPHKGNVIFGEETIPVAGLSHIREQFAGLKLLIRPDTFFQVNTEMAEVLVDYIIQQLQLQGDEIFIDAYCGIGTFTLPIAQRVKQAIAIECQAAAVEQAEVNALMNDITNVSFRVGNVQKLLPRLEINPDLVLLDPPRKGCDRQVIDTLREMKPKRIVYISCQPANLARDIQHLCADHVYKLTLIQPADFFPQTAHIECAAFLELTQNN